MSLRKRLLLTLFALAIVPIAVIVSVLSVGAFHLVEEQARQEFGGSLDKLSSLIRMQLDEESRVLRPIVSTWTAVHSVEGVTLSDWMSRNPDLHARLLDPDSATSRFFLLESGKKKVYRFELDERLRTGDSGIPLTLDAGEPSGEVPDSYIEELSRIGSRRGASLAVETLFGYTGTTLSLSLPIPATAKNAPGLLIEEIDAASLVERILAGPAFSALWSSFVAARSSARGEWRFVHHSDPTLLGLSTERDETTSRLLEPLISRVSRSENPSGKFERPGHSSASRWHFNRSGDHLLAAGFQPETGWLIGGSLSLLPRMQPVREGVRLSLVLLAIMTVLVIGGILHVTRGIGRAVEEIASGTSAIARGDLERSLAVRRSDEFKTIADHVNRMAQELMITAESRAVTQLSSRLVHDLKGVASQMNLLLYNLRENPDDPEFRSEFVGLMEGLVKQIESLTLELRRTGERGEPTFEEVDLDRLVRAVLEGPVVTTRAGIRVEMKLGSSRPVVSDEGLLREIVENVVSNAVEAMGDTGRLEVRTGMTVSLDATDGSTHFLEIEDDGPGMSEEFIEKHLFRPFSTTKEKGIGLGMYHVRQIVGELGGTIEVTAPPGAGTRVRVEIGRGERP